MAKVYITHTPLILETPKGTQYRVEAGETVELTAEQYQQVAAHVTPSGISAAGLATPADTPDSEPAPPEAPADTPKRTRGKAEA